jgi:hypothetical protein
MDAEIMPRPKQYATPADRQEAYRLRNAARLGPLARLVEALTHAADRGRCHRLAEDLPADPELAAAELTRRLNDSRIIVVKRE